MGLRIFPSLSMLVALLLWLLDSRARAQSNGSAQALDALLQGYAYQAFNRPKTGIAYDGVVPMNLTGITISAMRLRSGSLRTRGVKMYKEIEIPKGVIVSPYVERLVLVYQNLGNWSSVYYPLSGYTYLAPVLGLIPYDASNLSAKNLPQLLINASGEPISIKFEDRRSEPAGSVAMCVSFDSDGSPSFSNVASGNFCSTTQQGHFGIVVESSALPPAPGVAPSPPPGTRETGGGNSKVWIIIGSVIGGLVLLVLLALFLLWLRKFKRRKKMQQMEKAAEFGEALHMTNVGNTKAPAAMVTRTQPILESEYVP